MLLLQEFDLEIRDKKGTENLVVDHLSRIEDEICKEERPIQDYFPDEQLLLILEVYQNIKGCFTEECSMEDFFQHLDTPT